MSPITNERQQLIDKVLKLMALADSTNHPAERDNALNKAAELQARHNIKVCELAVDAELEYVIVREDTGRSSKSCKHEDILHNYVAQFCGVAFVRYNGHYRYIGRPCDIDAFKYMRDLIINQRNAAWRAYYPKKWGKHPGAQKLNEWKYGFALGLATKIVSIMEGADNKFQEWGLVPVHPAQAALDWYKNDHETTTGRQTGGKYNTAGYNAGQNVSLNRGIDANSNIKQIGR